MQFRPSVQTILTHRRLPWALAAMVLLLMSPSLGLGWQLDDFVHRLLLLEQPNAMFAEGHPWTRLFRFVHGDTSTIERYKDLGFLPWWSSAHLKIYFWRPLAAISHWVDYQLWPHSAPLMHLHSLLWLGFAIVLTTYLFRAFEGTTWIAGMAALLWAINDIHSTPGSWIANRNILLGVCGGVACLWCYHKWRKEQWKWGMILSPLCLFLALLSAEAAIAIGAYLLAYAIFYDNRSWLKRGLSLLPFGAVVVVWRWFYQTLGYGASGSGFYVDPLQQPVDFLIGLGKHIPITLTALWGIPGASLYPIVPPAWTWWWWGWGCIFTLFLVWQLWPWLKQSLPMRFWATSTFLCLIPISSTFPHDRHLLFASIGAMGLLAHWAANVWQDTQESTLHRQIQRWSLGIIMVLHLVIAPLLLPLKTQSFVPFDRLLKRMTTSITKSIKPQHQQVILVNTPNTFINLYTPMFAQVTAKPWPIRVRLLAPGQSNLSMYRPDRYTLELQPETGYLVDFDRLLRAPSHTTTPGQSWKLKGLVVKILSVTNNGRPLRVSFRFSTPLEHPSLCWLQWKGKQGYVLFRLPLVGKKRILPGIGLSYLSSPSK